MRISPAGFAALLLAATLGRPAVAQDLRGAELRLNQNAAAALYSVDVAALPNGDFVTVWFARPSLAEKPVEIRARRFFADGRAKGGETRVARLPQGSSFYGRSLQVAADAAGRFFVVWGAPATTSRLAQVFGQRFDAAGRPTGPRLRFAASTHGEVTPDVAMAPDGRAVVVWQSFTDRFDNEGFRLADVYFRRLRPDGTFAGPPVLAVSEGEISRVAMRADGSFGLATEIYNGEASFYDIYLSLYAADGGTLREPFEITSGLNETAAQYDPAIAAAADGRMFVAWTDRAADTDVPGSDGFYDPVGVAGQLIAADGTLLGENLAINTFKKGVQDMASVVATPNGGFLVAWETGAGQDGDGYGIFARHFAADGRRLGGEIRINLARQGNQTAAPALALAGNGQGVAAWSGAGILARRLAPPER
ncbi:MAG TPA: hypothetical protein VGS22_16000 [Thermoanaerobaculia bacterium]|jgi:hypothetical protein|nr:hypothetical protein [Thermoanaerobaculia bacterium]